jgi:hypothetical protein
MQWIACAELLALPKAGNSSAARIAMMAMTTSNSMRVKAKKETEGFLTEGNEDNEGDEAANGRSGTGSSVLRSLRLLL